MRKLVLMVGILMVAFMGFAAMAAAQEGCVFGNGVLVRAFVVCESGCDSETPLYSASLEVRDEEGNLLDLEDFRVEGVLGTSTPVVTTNPFRIHNGDLVNNDISISYDNFSKTLYVFNTDTIEGLHVSKYDISLTAPINGVCVTYSTGLTQTPADLCLAGDPSVVAGSGPWSWTCYGLNEGSNATCSAQLKVNGDCGSSDGGTFATAPTTNLCASGTASAVTGSGPWNWTCAGVYGGTTDTCSASLQASGNRIDLGIYSFSAPSAVTYSSSWTAKVVVKNYSSNTAGAFNLKFYKGSALVSTVPVSALAGGASATVYATMYLHISAHTSAYITVVVEPNTLDTDTSTTNNSSIRSVGGV